MSERNDKPTQPVTTDLARREALRRFGVYAAYTAPAMTVLLASRQGHAMGSKHSKKGGGSGGGGFSS